MPQPKTEQRDGHTIHFSVGALIKQGNRYLLIDRAKPPYGYAGLAGHIDEGEDAQAAIAREIQEESQLKVIGTSILHEEYVPWNKCSHGTEGHYWYVFACEVAGEAEKDQREAKAMGWYTMGEIKQLRLEPVWKYWFEKLELI